MLEVNDISDGELLGNISMGPDGALMATPGIATELVAGWRDHGFEDPTIYEQILPGWSNGYLEVVPGMPDPGDNLQETDLGKVDADGWRAHGFDVMPQPTLVKADAPPITNPHAGPDYDPSALGLDATQLQMVDPQVPNVDRQNYQRDLDLDRVALYEQAPGKDLKNRVGLLARRPDGSLWTIDGQHHTLAAIGRGIKKLPYRIFDSTGPKQEAQVFETWNKRERRN